MRLFCDTNILIDYLAQRKPFFQDALKLRIAASYGDVELWACTQSFADAEYILRRAVPTSTLRNMMNECLSFLHVATPSEKALSAGLQSDWPDLEDFLIAQCAHEQGAHYLITRDVKGFAKSRIPVKTPHEFLQFAEKELCITYESINCLESNV